MKRYFSHFNAFDLVFLTACVIAITVFYPNFWIMVGIAILIFVEMVLKVFIYEPADCS